MVTQSSRRSGSIAMAQTSAGGAAMSMLASTSLMCERQASTDRGRSSPRDVPERLEVAQRPLDCGVERVQADAEQLARAVVAGQQVAAEAAHERLDQRRVLAGDRGRDPAGDGGQA